VLKGADAIVFVADSERGKMDENKESLSNLRANLAEYKVNLDDLPWVLQYNKRDLPDVYTPEELNRELNPGSVPWVEAVATKGWGVLETFRLVSQMLLERVTKDLKRSPSAGGGRSEVPRPAPAAPTTQPASPATSSFAPPPAAPRPVAPSSPAAANPFTTTRGEFGTQHPAAERAERNAPAPPTLRSIQRENPVMPPQSGSDAGFFQRDVTLPGERTLPPAPPTQVTATATARNTTGGEPLVVPITLDGSVKEIVLRIVIEQAERVEPRR